MAYGYKDIVCAPMRKRNIEAHMRRIIRYLTTMAILNNLYHRGEISLSTWYVAENALAARYRLCDNSIYRPWTPNSIITFEQGRSEHKYYFNRENE